MTININFKVIGTTAVVIVIVAVIIARVLMPAPIKGAQDVLGSSQIIKLPEDAVGPESIQFDLEGEGPYTGVADGRVLKWEGLTIGWTNFANTTTKRANCDAETYTPAQEDECGRPLGLHLSKKNGRLYICDCYLGLRSVGPEGGLATLVVDEANGQKFHFTNHLDVDEDGDDTIYFTDSSYTNAIRTLMTLFYTVDRTGRLIKYNPKTKEATVLIEGMFFPNGVALSKDKSFVLIAESGYSRVLRYWLTGPDAGKQDVFADLPGFPDNIVRNADGDFWVGVDAVRGPIQKFIFDNPWLARLIGTAFNFKTDPLFALLIGFKPQGIALKLSEKGEIVQVLVDSKGTTLSAVSEAYEKDGKLWIGSIYTSVIGVYDLK